MDVDHRFLLPNVMEGYEPCKLAQCHVLFERLQCGGTCSPPGCAGYSYLVLLFV